MALALLCAFLAGCFWWYPTTAFAMSLAIPLSRHASWLAAGLAVLGAAAAFVSAYFFARSADTRLWPKAGLPLCVLSGLLLTHVCATRVFDIRENLDPFAGAPSAHDSCVADVATSVTTLSQNVARKKGSPYIDVVLDVEARLPVEVAPAGEPREQNTGARFPLEVEPKTLPSGKGRLTLRLLDADGLAGKRALKFINLAVYLRSATCEAQPRAVLAERVEVALSQ